MKENALSVPHLSPAMYKEWKSKQKFLRQASRMVYKEQNRELREKKLGSRERQEAALGLCRAAGTVTDYLEERNEMSETVRLFAAIAISCVYPALMCVACD